MSTSDASFVQRRGDVAIDIRGVRKRFKLYDNAYTGPLKELLYFWKRKSLYREFVAVHDVSLQIRRGEVIGIIGPNGAGKTTLLKMIAGLLPVDGGSIRLNGRVTALLALGVGVHPEFSGRENIYYGGLLLGMSREEVLAKLPGIVEFAELGDFIDRPFRTYSSGMKARLLFAIAMSIDPDILIVDEALATGDAYFVRKSSARIRELCDSGATIMFVSHNLRQIQELCDRAYLLWKGSIVYEGDPTKVIAEYNRLVFHHETELLKKWARPDLPLLSGNGAVVVTDVVLRGPDGAEANGFFTGDAMEVEIHYRAETPAGEEIAVFVGFLQSRTFHYVGAYNSEISVDVTGQGVRRVSIGAAGIITVRFDPLLLTTSDYSLWLILYREGETFAEYKGVRPFFVSRRDDITDRFGAFLQPGTIRASKLA
jgi:ABC-type polysaccharide/polyol phosphate transport system ATPase subunit